MKTSLFLLSLLIPVLSFGQNEFCTKGTVEMGGDIGFSSYSNENGGGGNSVLIANFFVGIMALPGFEVGIRPGIILQEATAGGSDKVYNLFFNPSYNFKTDAFVYPFLGAIVGYNAIENSGDRSGGMGYGGEGGIKFNLKGNCNLLVRFEYLTQSFSSNTINTLSLGLGFRIFL